MFTLESVSSDENSSKKTSSSLDNDISEGSSSVLLSGDSGAVPEEGDGNARGNGLVAERTLDSLPFDTTKTVQKSGAHLITLLGMSSTLNSL